MNRSVEHATIPGARALAAPLVHGAAPSATSPVRDLVSLTKPRLSALVLVTAGGGLWLSGAPVSAPLALAAIGGTTLAVGGANALNNYLERESDRWMARTRDRPLPAGRMWPPVALATGILLSLVAVVILALATTPLAAALAAVAVVSYAGVYTPLKSRTSLSTLAGAVPGALPPLIGWTAATGRLDAGGLALFALLFFWQVPHSLAIGLYRKAEYARAGLVVFPLEHGDEATRRQMLLYALPLVVLPLVLAHQGVAGAPTAWVGTGLGIGMVVLVARGWLRRSGAPWARRVFLFTLAHLTVLFAVLAADRLV